MKMEYESPVLDVFSFDVNDVVMDSGECTGFENPEIGCIVDVDVPDCPMDCPVDGECVLDGVCVTDGLSGV